jgi:transposase InsO family protein
LQFFLQWQDFINLQPLPSPWWLGFTLKAEYFRLATLDGLEELEVGVHNYIRYYNHDRIKLGLKGLSPVEYRLRNTT